MTDFMDMTQDIFMGLPAEEKKEYASEWLTRLANNEMAIDAERATKARAWLETIEEPERVLANDIVAAHLKHMNGSDPGGMISGWALVELHEWQTADYRDRWRASKILRGEDPESKEAV